MVYLQGRSRFFDHFEGLGDHSLDILPGSYDGEGEKGGERVVVVASDDQIREILERNARP